VHRHAHVKFAKRIEFCFELLLAELALKETAADGNRVEAGKGIRGAIHSSYLRHITNEQVERDVPAKKKLNLTMT
jgi:hypothetical protein